MTVKRTYTRGDLKELDYLSKEQLALYVPWKRSAALKIINAGYFPVLTNPLLETKKGVCKYYRRKAVDEILLELEETAIANIRKKEEKDDQVTANKLNA